MKLMINLLPPEVVMMEKQASKLSLANRFSIGALLVLVGLTSATFGIRFIQNNVLNEKNQSLVYAQNEVSNLKDKEGYAVLLKKRLDTIEKLSSDNKRVDTFLNVLNLVPSDIQISLISVERDGTVLVSAVSPTTSSIDTFLAVLQDKNRNGDSIQKVELRNLSRGRDGLYRYDINITPK